MSTPILSTKLYIPPPRSKVVRRPRLIEKLDEDSQRKLILISAPAGFGKTTLVSEWVVGCERSVAWLSLDEGDNELTRFLTYLVTALQTIEANVGEGVLAMLQSPQPTTASILTALLNDIATIPDQFVLVLDDYHLIDAEPVDSALSFVLKHLPPQMLLVIATREDPSLPLARLRARSQLTELRVADLRFTPAEAAELLNQAMGLSLSADNIAALEARTEGWVAGLQLAAISMQGHEDASRFIASFTGSHRFVMDYLVEEVLQQQPDSIQVFLLRTSILNRLCGPLCDAVVQAPGTCGRETLAYLEQANLLLVPLDDQRQWYRYHHLFADVLQARLMQQQPDEIADLHLRASEWYVHNDLLSDAIHHAFAAEDFERAAGLIEQAWPAIHRSTFQSPAFMDWVKALPSELIRTRPLLSIAHAWALLDIGELQAAEPRIQDAECGLDNTAGTAQRSEAKENEEQYRSLAAHIANARAYHAQALSDTPATIKYASRALELLPATDHHGHGITAALLGLAQWASGDLEAAYTSLTNAMASLRKTGNLAFAISVTVGLAEIRVTQGRLIDAIRVCEQSLQLAQGEPALQGTADLYLGLSRLHHEQGNLETAKQYLLKSETLGEQAGLPDWPHRLCLAQAGIKQAEGDLDGALDLLDEAERLYYITPLPVVRPIAALKVRIWIKQGRLNKALAWVHEQKLSIDDKLSFLREFEHITVARLRIARHTNHPADGAIHETVNFIERLLNAAEGGVRTGSVIELLVLQALARQTQGDITAALASLQHALTLAEPEGCMRVFVDEGAPMAELLSTAATHGMMPDSVNKLLAVLHTGTPSTERQAPASSTLIEPLSLRELKVLKLIAQGLSNREISEKLFLALDTVKGHNRRLFAKLQVQRRTEAVAKARSLNII